MQQCDNRNLGIYIKRGIYISAAHIRGKENTIVDLAPREFQDSTDFVHTGTRICNSNTYYYRESAPLSASHQQTTPALSKAEFGDHILLQEQALTGPILETPHRIISASTD